ncbi:MAG: LTA synthase family protein [Lachnospiraceae bacterium]|nr:LTA synthase family protein [Lachnospiraceae bacterium]
MNKKSFLKLISMGVMLVFLIAMRKLFFGPLPDTGIEEDLVPPLADRRVAVFWFLLLLTVLAGFDAMRAYLRDERKKTKKSQPKPQKKQPWAAIICGLILALNSILSFFVIELINNPYLYEKITLPYHILGWCITALFYVFFVFLTNSFSLGMTIGNWFFTVWGIVNYFVTSFRGLPLQWVDFGSMRTAMAVSGNYKYAPTWQIVSVIVLTADITGFYLHVEIRHNMKSKAGKIVSRVIATATTVVFFSLFIRSDFFASLGMTLSSWAPERSYQEYGMEASFLDFAKASIPEAPASYSKAHVREIISSFWKYAFSSEENDRATPENIIFIMDESFADFSVYPHFQADTDTMPFIHSMEENTVSGNLLVSVKGGNTANTEYEVLTGNSCEFAPSTVAYNSFIRTNQYALPRILRSQGYETVAIHPFHRYGWNRPSVYEHMGFDSFLSLDDAFEGADTVRDYVTDEADFDKLIELVQKKKKGAKLFLFNVTMQNHGQYKYAPFEATVHVPDFNGENKSQAEQYLTLAHMTDEAVKKLITYFESSDEKTMIVFWGDHQPMIGDDFWEYCLGVNDMDSITFEQRQLMYLTRFFIWTNYRLPKGTGATASGDLLSASETGSGDEHGDRNGNETSSSSNTSSHAGNAPTYDAALIGSTEAGSYSAAGTTLISSNYLAPYVLSLTGLTMSGYEQYLLHMQASIPAMNAFGYLDSDGSMHEWGSSSVGKSDSALVDDYNSLIYSELSGGSSRDASFFGIS